MPIEKIHDFKRPTRAESEDLQRRAIAAWLAGGEHEMPITGKSGFRMHDGLGYVVLHGAAGVLGVYRVRPDNGALRRMKRWPANIER